MARGKEYTFITEGGTNTANLGMYHPFYISDSIHGGRLRNTGAVAVRTHMPSMITCYIKTCTQTHSREYSGTPFSEQQWDLLFVQYNIVRCPYLPDDWLCTIMGLFHWTEESGLGIVFSGELQNKRGV